ncbi:MAG: oligosaccharide flippase family protein [Flavobacteriales bacterium]|nr:oligosaccharide flippase family protein [Flavobacteriales bacterium]
MVKPFVVHKKFLSNVLLLVVLNLVIKCTWIFGIDIKVQDLTKDDYGTYFALFNFSMLFNIFLDLGITSFNNKNIAQNVQLVTKYVSGIVVFKAILFVVYLIISMVVGFMMGYDDVKFHFLIFMSINQFLISFTQYLRTNLTGLELYTLDSVLSVLDKSLMIIFCGALLYTDLLPWKFSLNTFIYMQTLAYGITALIVFALVMSRIEKLTIKLNVPFLLAILRRTAPYALLVLTMTAYYRLDAIMLEYMLEDGKRQTAIYAQGARLLDAVTQFGYLMSTLLLPMFARMIKRREKVRSLVQLAFSIIIVPALILAFTATEYSIEIMDILYDRHTEQSGPVLGLLMMCFVAIASTYIFGTLLTANGSLRLLNQIAIAGLILNIVLNIILIPLHKAWGSAFASMLTQFIVVAIQIIMCKSIFRLRIHYKFLGSLVVFGGIALATTTLTRNHLDNLALQLSISVLVPLVFAVGIRIIDVGQIYKTIMKKEEVT